MVIVDPVVGYPDQPFLLGRIHPDTLMKDVYGAVREQGYYPATEADLEGFAPHCPDILARHPVIAADSRMPGFDAGKACRRASHQGPEREPYFDWQAGKVGPSRLLIRKPKQDGRY